MHMARPGFLLYFFIIVLLLAACGQAPSREEALQATVAALETRVASQPQPPDATQEILHLAGTPLAMPTSEMLRPTEAPFATPGPVPLNRVGSWEIACEGVEELPQYSGGSPAEGHTWYGVNLLAVNITNQPISINPNSAGYRDIGGYIQARWKNFVYSPYGYNGVYGNIPPGWPIRFQAVFDLPSAAKDSVTLQLTIPPPPYPTPRPQSTPEPVALNTLPTQLTPVPPPLAKLGTTLVITDRLSIAPTKVTVTPNGELAGDAGYGGYRIAVTANVTNLGGSDIQFPLNLGCTISIEFLYHDTIGSGGTCGSASIIWNNQGQRVDYGTIPPGTSKELIFVSDWIRDEEKPAMPPLLLVFIPNSPIWALYDVTGNGTDTLHQPLTMPTATPLP